MDDVLDELKPIVEIVGRQAVTATYSDTTLVSHGSYSPGWEVKVDASYRGANLRFRNTARTLKEAAGATHAQLKAALGSE